MMNFASVSELEVPGRVMLKHDRTYGTSDAGLICSCNTEL